MEKVVPNTAPSQDEPLASDPIIEAMFKAGAHFGYAKSRRHPTVAPYIFGMKNRVEIFDLEKTKTKLGDAQKFIASVAAGGGVLLFVGGKVEAREAIERNAKNLTLPFVAGRWIGGTFTNFNVIRTRVERLESLLASRDKGELSKYTKKERILIDRDIANLERFFGGLALLKSLPKAVFIVDPRQEKTAVSEAKKRKIPIVALAGSDCDLNGIDYPIPANDSARGSITFFVDQIARAYEEGKKETQISNSSNA
ncbi:MAG TPA: 30S ribosomal protein S2 [Candidatus Magasanikbacteria bacterium]|nr:30S ribosomal protein S2 [Candidatus Magasanikbacteria bacterium]